MSMNQAVSKCISCWPFIHVETAHVTARQARVALAGEGATLHDQAYFAPALQSCLAA